MSDKRAQITAFIIIGVIIISFIVIFYFARDQVTNQNLVQQELQTSPIQNYIESCIQQVGETAIIEIGRQGGYFELPEKHTEDYVIRTAYYFYYNESLMPTQTEIEQQLSDFMDSELFFCLRNFVDFKLQGFQIQQGTSRTNTIIAPNRVLFNVEMPLTVTRERRATQIVSFSNSVENIRLKTIIDFNNHAIAEQMNDTTSICISCLLTAGIENDLYLDMQRFGNDSIAFTITDFNSEIRSQPYQFIFANKYLT